MEVSDAGLLAMVLARCPAVQGLGDEMKTLVERIQAEDPCFEPLSLAVSAAVGRLPGAEAAEKAGMSPLEYVRAAMARVYFDGYYGPISDAEWQEQDGRLPYSVEDALAVLAVVSEEISDYVTEEYVGDDDDGEPVYEPVVRADAADIRRDVFRHVVEIYGGLPW